MISGGTRRIAARRGSGENNQKGGIALSGGKVFIELKDIVKIFPGVRALDGV